MGHSSHDIWDDDCPICGGTATYSGHFKRMMCENPKCDYGKPKTKRKNGSCSMFVFWEHEDRLPKVSPSEFGVMYLLSRIIDGARMYPYVLDEEGDRIYIGFGSRGCDE